jgi:lactoylglutathione lyase
MTLSRRTLLAAGSGIIASAAVPNHAKPVEQETSMDGLSEIKQIDYTVIYARDMGAMLRFYQQVMGFAIARRLGEGWIELRAGSNTLALALPGVMFNDPLAPKGTLSLQLAFRVSPSAVQRCAEELQAKGVKLVHDVTDQPWGHRTVFFRDPDGNVIEIYAEI